MVSTLTPVDVYGTTVQYAADNNLTKISVPEKPLH